MINVNDEEIPYIQYTMDVDGIKVVSTSNETRDNIVCAYDADKGYDYILCGNKRGTKIIADPTDSGSETYYTVPYDVADEFVRVLNRRNYMGLDWVAKYYY